MYSIDYPMSNIGKKEMVTLNTQFPALLTLSREVCITEIAKDFASNFPVTDCIGALRVSYI